MYTAKQAYEQCFAVVKNELVAQVLTEKYLLCDENKNYVETTPQMMWRRLAKANAIVEKEEIRQKHEDEFYSILENFKFVPAGRILYGLGNNFVSCTLKNCYVIGINEDSMKGIFDCGYKMAETYKSGGGVGVDISPLRPKGSTVKNAAKMSSGSVNFMDFYSNITGMIGQHGRIGALLLSIDCDHPDVEDFIKIKGGDNLDKVRYANVSIKIKDTFMQAVVDNQNYDLTWGGKVYKTIKARDLWTSIMTNAWRRAEPGLLFWDATTRTYPAAQYKEFYPICTNPCGELALSDGDSCDLGSMNLGMYVKNSWENNRYFDFASFKKDVGVAVRFLDNIISLEKSPMPFQQWANDNGRRIGLGFMGLGDVFMRLGMKFDSEDALNLAEEIMQCFNHASYDASCDLAAEKGSFPVFEAEKHLKSEFIKSLPESIRNKISTTGIRNIGVHAIAPTGSISTIAQCTSAMEPAFKIHYIRKTNLGTSKEVRAHEVWHSTAGEYAAKFGVKAENLPDFFVGAHQVDNNVRVRLQGIVQRNIDQSISNTFNLPKETTPEQIGELYMEAWRHGLKGITVYRDGSREGVLVDVKDVKNDKQGIVGSKAPKRPLALDAKVHLIKPNGKTYAVFVGLLEGRVFEVFALDHKQAGISDGMVGKIIKEKAADGSKIYSFESGALLVRRLNGYEDNDASLVTRLISTSLRHGTPLEFVIDQVTKSKVPLISFAKAIAKALSHYVKQDEIKGKFKCSNCQSDDIHWEGLCRTCRSCGHSKCG